jgi:hypothetical protein
MATFYLLPPRQVLGQRLADYLHTLCPGLPCPSTVWADLADVVRTAAAGQPDVYVVHREELPPGEEPARALVDGFGAERGDEVVEVRPGPRPGEVVTLRWSLDGNRR